MSKIPDISLIVAVANKNAIGYKNDLLCHLPDDLKYFKKTTAGSTVIMGKRTFESLPNGALPSRTNIVLTDIKGETFPETTPAYSIEEVLSLCSTDKENFIIGGGSIYKQFFPLAGKLYITHIHGDFEADTFFPEINPTIWDIASETFHPKDERHPYSFTFTVYRKKNNE